MTSARSSARSSPTISATTRVWSRPSRGIPDRGRGRAVATVSTAPLSLIVLSVVVGGFTPAIVTLVLGRIHEFVPNSTEQQRTTWSYATTSFALFQAAAAYGFSWIDAQTGGDYLVLFGLGGGAVVLASRPRPDRPAQILSAMMAGELHHLAMGFVML